eukprot:m.207567 g.207567  ORF g.207567 m.207567 type:complete len:135 (+) comp13762_c0_seq37:120-524(+)
MFSTTATTGLKGVYERVTRTDGGRDGRMQQQTFHCWGKDIDLSRDLSRGKSAVTIKAQKLSIAVFAWRMVFSTSHTGIETACSYSTTKSKGNTVVSTLYTCLYLQGFTVVVYLQLFANFVLQLWCLNNTTTGPC